MAATAGQAAPPLSLRDVSPRRAGGESFSASLARPNLQRRYPLEEINEAFHDLAQAKDGRGVIVFD